MIPGSPFWDAFLGVGVVTMVIFFIFIIIQSIIEDNRSNKEKTEAENVSKAIDDFEQFLSSDLPSKIFPRDETLEEIKGGEWFREDAFKNKEEVIKYIEEHFDVFRETTTNQWQDNAVKRLSEMRNWEEKVYMFTKKALKLPTEEVTE